MKDLIPLQGEYKELGWDPHKRDAVLCEFIEVIKRSDLVGFGVIVDVDAWALVPDEVKKIEGRDAHTFCLQRIMRGVVDRLERASPDDVVEVVFDRDEELASERFKIWSKVYRGDPRASRYLAALTFANPKEFLGLQAADLLAWETRKEAVQKRGGFESTGRFKDLFAQIPGHDLDYQGEWWSKDNIARAYNIENYRNRKTQT